MAQRLKDRSTKGQMDINIYWLIFASIIADSSPRTLVKITDGRIPDIRYGIKLTRETMGFNGQYYTFGYFLTIILRHFLTERKAEGENRI